MRILMLLFFITYLQIPVFAQNKTTLTNDDFPKSSTPSNDQSGQDPSIKALSTSANKTNNNASESPDGSMVRTSDLKLQYQLSDLMLAAAEYPNDQDLKDQMAEVRKKMNAISVLVSKEDWINIYWRNQLVFRKISIIQLEKKIKSHQDQITSAANNDPYNSDIHRAVVYVEKEKAQLSNLYEDYEKALEQARKEGAKSRVYP